MWKSRARDENRLKDGTKKISGTIVGFESGSFRVETAYGFLRSYSGQGRGYQYFRGEERARAEVEIERFHSASPRRNPPYYPPRRNPIQQRISRLVDALATERPAAVENAALTPAKK